MESLEEQEDYEQTSVYVHFAKRLKSITKMKNAMLDYYYNDIETHKLISWLPEQLESFFSFLSTINERICLF